MHVFLSLAQAAALILGQGEPAEAPPANLPADTQEAAPAPSLGEPAAAPGPEAPATARPDRTADTPQAGAEAPAQQPATAVTAPAPRTTEPERTQVARAALAFLDALLAGDATALAAASAERFSFDGDLRTGKEEIRRAWRAALAGREPSQRGALLDLELLPAADAIARLGPPPARVASLAAGRGGWVAIANVSRRPVILFLGREAGRYAVIGME